MNAEFVADKKGSIIAKLIAEPSYHTQDKEVEIPPW